MRLFPLWFGPVAVVFLAAFLPDSRANEQLEGIACRSVHLRYAAPEGVAFYNEVTVRQSAEGSYFMVCGFNKGYFGIQEQSGGKKVVLFSVWDPGRQNDPRVTPEDRRVKVVYQDEKVRVKRFGGEGTGGQCFYDYDWKVGETYRFLVTSRVVEGRTEFAGYFFHPETKDWKHLVTFSTLAAGKGLGGYYSFIEDFRRNRVSTTHVRAARFDNGWVKAGDGQWVALRRARFTADSNPVTNINAAVEGEGFSLATGGDTRNTDTPLGKTMDRPLDRVPLLPETARKLADARQDEK